ncbi:MAG: NUDIX domain-containing protein [Chloroflexi bacterium]|nr:NUDIX domain-containing protein [Chloroflexota bacterium]
MTQVLQAYQPRSAQEQADVERLRQVAESADPWTRASPLHVTGSALVVHPPTGRVLLRWHARLRGWLQVGGHADPGETDPFAVALREALEETGLHDLQAWPNAAAPEILHVAVVPVPAGNGEPPHHHGDIRYALSTGTPEAIVPETDAAPVRWLSLDEALAETGKDNLRIALRRIANMLVQTAA